MFDYNLLLSFGMSQFLQDGQSSQKIVEKKRKIEEIQCQKYPILKKITPSTPYDFLISETLIQTEVKLEENSEENYTLRLKDQFIIFYLAQDNISQPLFYIQLDFNKLFAQVLNFENQISTSTQKSSDQLKGFKIIDQKKQQICFYIKFSSLTKIWVKYLSKFIIQTGFENQFKPIRRLGKGGSASVYEVMRIYDGQRFAAKSFSKEAFQNNREKFNAFLNEINIVRSIDDQDNIIKVHGVYETDTNYFIIMDNLTGGNLYEYLMRKKQQLKTEEIKKIMRGIIKGLIKLEEYQIIHRDLKMENLMMRDKYCISPILVDFGLAVYADQEDYIYHKCGTPGFISPEIIKGNKEQKITPTSDVFSAGAIFHVLLMGKYIFPGKDPKQIYEKNMKLNVNLSKLQYQKIDSSALQLLKKMLSIDPKDRYTASQCLEHPYLLEQQKQVSPAPTNAYQIDYCF